MARLRCENPARLRCDLHPELAALDQLFAGSMRTAVHPVLAELTLAGRAADLAPFRAQGAASLTAAEAEIDRLLLMLR